LHYASLSDLGHFFRAFSKPRGFPVLRERDGLRGLVPFRQILCFYPFPFPLPRRAALAIIKQCFFLWICFFECRTLCSDRPSPTVLRFVAPFLVHAVVSWHAEATSRVFVTRCILPVHAVSWHCCWAPQFDPPKKRPLVDVRGYSAFTVFTTKKLRQLTQTRRRFRCPRVLVRSLPYP